MSLPLTRRIAKAALLTAAGAASVVGATGSAGAVDLQQATDLGGLSNLDTAGVADTAGDAAGTATGLAGEVGGDALRGGMPTGELVSQAGESVTPVAEEVVDDTLDTANGELGDTVLQATQAGPAGDVGSGALPAGDLTGDLPLGGLPTGNLLG